MKHLSLNQMDRLMDLLAEVRGGVQEEIQEILVETAIEVAGKAGFNPDMDLCDEAVEYVRRELVTTLI